MIKIKQSEFSNFLGRAKNLYHIRSENNELVTYTPNEAQLILNQIKEEEFERSEAEFGVKRCKIILLKSRQIGGTTDTAVFNLDTMMNLNLAYGLVLAHDDKSTNIIYEKYKVAYDNIPEYVEIVDDNGDRIDKGLIYEVKPKPESYSGYKLQFSNKTKSRLLVRTAGAGDNVGRGDTLNFVHLCLGEDTKIILSDGSTKLIKDIDSGDLVITSSGVVAPVKQKFNSGIQQTFKLKTWLSNEEIYPTEKHKILTDKGYKLTKDITNDDYIALPKFNLTNEITHYNFEITDDNKKKNPTIIKHSFELNYDFGYMLGYYLAEGHIKDNFSQVSFTYNRNEHYINKVIKDFGYLASSYKKKERKNSLTTKTIFYGKILPNLLNEICGRVKDKNIPTWFLKTNENFVKGVIKGYFDGDGSKTQSIYKPKSKSKNIKTQPSVVYEYIKNINYGKETISQVANRLNKTYQTIWKLYNKYKNSSLKEIEKNFPYLQNEYKIQEVSSTSIHEKITRQLKRLVLSLNLGVPSVRYNKNVYRYDKKVSSTYILGMYGSLLSNFDVFNFKGNTKKEVNKYKNIDGTWFVKIKSIEPYKIEQTYDIEVDHKDHNFETVVGVVSNSEGASYDHFDDVLTSINQSLPKSAFNYAIIESTANGISGKGEGFYNLWKKSVDEWDKFKSGRTSTFQGYRPVFISWYLMKKYRLPLVNNELIDVESVNFGSPENKKRFYDTEKVILEEIFADDRQEGLKAINWYRWCVKENCNYDYARARREYPTFPEDAFLSTDMCFFDTSKLFSVLNKYEDGEPDCEMGVVDYDEDGELVFQPDPFGDLKVWEHPDLTYMNRYIVSLDPSYGMQEGDYSCMFVFDRLEQKFVAKWYGNMKEDLVAEELLKLAYYYNEALIIPEMNLNTVMTLIKPDGIMPYTGEIYQRYIKSRNSEEYGFHTLGNTRKLLLDSYNAWLREDYNKIPDIESLKEHISFIKRKGQNGLPRYEAAEGKHDDQVIAMALCIVAHNWWDEEVWELDEDKQDVSKIFVVNPSFKKKELRSSQVGHFKSYEKADKKSKFNKVGFN